ncbi:MAG: PQQ-dependent sugar dehydrogenase, partial [Bradyrhizobiaceae bacterium]|nr:PQQ-dependent sugar dehydrogenase [Bradyrhizobiaceae bacterium]
MAITRAVILTVIGGSLLAPSVLAPVTAQQNIARENSGAGVLRGRAAFTDWSADRPGLRRHITPADLPAADLGGSYANGVRITRRAPGQTPSVAPPFAISLFAEGLEGPRQIRAAPNGDIFIAETGRGRVRVLRPTEQDRPVNELFASGLSLPFGIAFYPPGPDPQWIYVANTGSVVRFSYRNGDLAARGGAEIIVPQLPVRGHSTRDLAFSPDGRKMFVSVGSASNVAEQIGRLDPAALAMWTKQHPLGAAWGSETERADVLVFDPDGKNRRIYATGIRNCVGLAIGPAGDLWCSTNERDSIGDDVPSDYITRVREGAFYGWPWYYLGRNEDPRHAGERPDLKDKVTVPDVLLQAHSASLGLAFYNGTQFPPEYRGSLFAAEHGSWNRSKRTGSKVIRVILKDGEPTGEYEDFVTGFVLSDAAAWGRPVGVTV